MAIVFRHDLRRSRSGDLHGGGSDAAQVLHHPGSGLRHAVRPAHHHRREPPHQAEEAQTRRAAVVDVRLQDLPTLLQTRRERVRRLRAPVRSQIRSGQSGHGIRSAQVAVEVSAPHLQRPHAQRIAQIHQIRQLPRAQRRLRSHAPSARIGHPHRPGQCPFQLVAGRSRSSQRRAARRHVTGLFI